MDDRKRSELMAAGMVILATMTSLAVWFGLALAFLAITANDAIGVSGYALALVVGIFCTLVTWIVARSYTS